MPAVFDACPVCRQTLDDSVLAKSPPLCPGCGTDLTQFIELARRGSHYARLGLEWLARGRTAVAREVVHRLRTLQSDPGPEYDELAARLAVLDGNAELAQHHLAGLSPDLRGALEAQLESTQRGARRARELYNYALSAARSGSLSQAAEHLVLAARLSPAEPAIWQLKAKVDLKAGLWSRLYDDLRTLDQLGARPRELAGAERLLPPLPEAV